MLKAAFLSSLLALQIFGQVGALTDQRVVELTKAGLREDELIRLIQTAPAVQFSLTPSYTDWMLAEGVTENVIRAMAGREAGTTYTPAPSVYSLATPNVTALRPVAPVSAAPEVTIIQSATGVETLPLLAPAVPARDISPQAGATIDYLTEQEVLNAIDSARRRHGRIGLTLNDIQENLLTNLACKTCGQSGYTITIYTPVEWIEILTSRADKEMLPFSSADITPEMRARMLRVEALPSRPEYITGTGLSLSSSVHRVVLTDSNRVTVIQPAELENGTVESNSAFRSATFSTAAAAFRMSDVDRLRASDSKKEFFVVVVGDRQNKYFKVKRKDFRVLFGK